MATLFPIRIFWQKIRKIGSISHLLLFFHGVEKPVGKLARDMLYTLRISREGGVALLTATKTARHNLPFIQQSGIFPHYFLWRKRFLDFLGLMGKSLAWSFVKSQH